MADINTDQSYKNVTLMIMDNHTPPRPAMVDGVPVWASSDPTVLAVTPAADGMSAVVDTVTPGTARISISADADLGSGVVPITGASENINVTLGPAGPASVMTLDLGAPSAKA